MVFSLIVWLVVSLVISWILGNWTIYKIGLPLKYSQLEENPLAILIVGFLGLLVLCLVLGLLK